MDQRETPTPVCCPDAPESRPQRKLLFSFLLSRTSGKLAQELRPHIKYRTRRLHGPPGGLTWNHWAGEQVIHLSAWLELEV